MLCISRNPRPPASASASCITGLLLSAVVACASALFSAAPAAHAEPITYTLSGLLSGQLGAHTGSTSFTNAFSTLTFIGDTSTTQNLGGGFYINTAGVSTFSIAGIGRGTFSSPTLGVESEYGAFAFYDIPDPFAIGLSNGALGAYDLSAISAPVTGTGVFLPGNLRGNLARLS